MAWETVRRTLALWPQTVGPAREEHAVQTDTGSDCYLTDGYYMNSSTQFSSVQSSHSVVSNSLQPHGLQQARLPYHQHPELAQIHVHQVGDTMPPSHPLSFPSPPAFNLS